MKNITDYIEKYKKLPRDRKNKANILLGGLGITSVAAAWVAFMPDRETELKKWDPEYSSKCYTSDPDGPNLKSTSAQQRLRHIDTIMRGANPIAVAAAVELNNQLEREVICFGERSGDEPVSRWFLTGVTVIEKNYPDSRFALGRVSDFTKGFWNKNITNMNERLTIEHGLFYSRFQRSLEAALLIDSAYKMHSKSYGSDIFNSQDWLSLEQNKLIGDAVLAYREEVEQDLESPIKGAFLQLMGNGTFLNDGDIDFMRRYFPYLENSYQQCYARNKDGFCTMNITHYTSPSSHIHSMGLNFEHLESLISFATGQDSFMPKQDIQTMFEGVPFPKGYSQDADRYLTKIYAKIREYDTQEHYQGDVIGVQRIYNQGAFASPKP